VIHVRTYMSMPLKRLRGAYIYVPPGYDRETARRYPVHCCGTSRS
jgi:hypothetical protein